MLALGAELVRRGHQVRFETWSHWRDAVEAEGMAFTAAPEYPVFPTRERPLQPYEAVVLATAETQETVRAFAPDLVVHDILTLAPALAGELEGAAVATLIPHLYPVGAPGFPPYASGARLPRTVLGQRLWEGLSQPLEAGLRLGRDQLNDTRRRLGLPPRADLHGGLSRDLCLVATFPALEYPRRWPAHVRVTGPLFWEPPAPAVELPHGEGPLILIAPSTAQDPGQRMLDCALRGLGGLSVPSLSGSGRARVRVLASTNRRPLARAVPVPTPEEVALVNWLSYAVTMPKADLVICHAGHGTLVRALACGTPVLAVPHVGDMAENAARVAWAGVGVRLPWRLLTPQTVRWATAHALDPAAGFRARAARLRAWADRERPAVRAAEALEGLLAGG